MKLDDSQKKLVAQWVNDGATLSEVQTKISGEFGISMTYMDVRFLVDDLDLELRDKAVSPAPETASESEEENLRTPPPPHPGQTPRGGNPHPFADEDEVPAGTPAADAAAAELAKVSVSVDPVQAPGVLVGGSVRFTDGVRAKWFVDSAGQLGIDGIPQGYSPSRDDAVQFRLALRDELRKLGYQ